jgi:hypothetical protein
MFSSVASIGQHRNPINANPAKSKIRTPNGPSPAVNCEKWLGREHRGHLSDGNVKVELETSEPYLGSAKVQVPFPGVVAG